MADRGMLRAARVAVFSLVVVLLAATGHGLAAGHRPPLALVAGGGAAVAVIAGRLAGRERSLAEISGAVVAARADPARPPCPGGPRARARHLAAGALARPGRHRPADRRRGWALPLLGWSLLGWSLLAFLVLDGVLGLLQRRRAGRPAARA
ncbi:hypothetical protein ABZZ79_09210 [Streptomyces sp. NPDC006458]|uniref:hypothetical protein n=1 Tax=Streptomyces sp. NPDC006458 TaxID=3154302 RepID=UPI0033AF89D0